MRIRSLFAIAAAAMTTVGACGDSIHNGWLVDRPRVLGARVSAATDHARASLGPSERATITWLVAVPEGTPKFAWAFAACVPPEGNFAEPRCEAPVVAFGSGAAIGEAVAMNLDVPPAAAIGEAKELLVLAAFCADGAPALDARTFSARCATGEPLLSSLVVRLASAGANANPPPPSMRLGDVPLPTDDGAAAGAGCDAAPSAPKVEAGGPAVDFVTLFGGAEREPNESIMLSTVVTGGTLDRQYWAFDREEAAPKELRIGWTPPGRESVGNAGRIVRFYALLRDGRGGASFGRFAVCVRPN